MNPPLMEPAVASPNLEEPNRAAAVRPRVAFISHTAEWVGPTNSLTLLLERLRSQFQVTVFVPGQGPFTEGLDARGIDWVQFRRLDKWDVWKVRSALKRFGADLLYANNTHSSSRIGLVAARLAGVPFITHVRGMAWDKGKGRMGYLRYADRVVAVSDACGASVSRFVRPGHLVTVHNGIPLSRDDGLLNRDSQTELRREFGFGPDDTVITSVSHVMPRKGQAHAVEAFRQIEDQFPNARLLLVGKLNRDPGYVEALEKTIDDAGLSEKAKIAGFRRDVSNLLQISDLFIHTAIADPHPRSVIEAMAWELPVVALAADGVAETVVPDETGFLTPVDEPQGLVQGLERLLGDEELRARMGKAGRQRVEAHFTDEATARGVAEQINQVLRSQRGTS